MTPKEKAEELHRLYIDYTYGDFNCKQCALIAVDEILYVVSKYNDTQAEVTYWEQVKQEIEKL